jgi:hypothetical protein
MQVFFTLTLFKGKKTLTKSIYLSIRKVITVIRCDINEGDIMKSLNTFMILILLFSMSYVSGKKQKNQPAVPDISKLQLIKPVRQNIQVNCVSINRKFYVIDNLVLSKQDVLQRKTFFFLNSDFTISEISAEGIFTQLKLYRNVIYTDFNPSIDEQVFDNVSRKCKIYELVIAEAESLPEQFNLKLKYHIPENDTMFVTTAGNGWIDFKGSDFWYPRNPQHNEDVSLFVKTTDENSFYLNGKSVGYIQKRYLKEYTTNFIDMADSPAALMFRKTGLK